MVVEQCGQRHGAARPSWASPAKTRLRCKEASLQHRPRAESSKAPARVGNGAMHRTGKQLLALLSMRAIIKKGVVDVRQLQGKSDGSADSEATTEALTSSLEAWTFPVLLITYSTLVLAWAAELAGSPYPHWAPPTVGFAVGATFSFMHRAATVRFWKQPQRGMNVVVTGGTRGIGRALVREFLKAGDSVYIAARSPTAVREAVGELQALCDDEGQVVGGIDCDVAGPADVQRLASNAKRFFGDGAIDIWVNNAGVSGSYKGFLDATEADLQRVVHTNLLGTLLCSRAAINAMAGQGRPGHVFNMDGAGADGTATPMYTAYGATKAGIAHLMASLSAELRESGTAVSMHTLSPGMVLTELLLEGATNTNKQFFNILCEQPEIVAAYLVPRARSVAARNVSMSYIRFLTNLKALYKFVSAPLRLSSRRYFSPSGEAEYGDAEERLGGSASKRTQRLLARSRQRGAPMRLAYSLSLCVALMILCVEPGTVSVQHLLSPAPVLSQMRLP